MDLGLQDSVALVTAASRGLGKAAAMTLAQEGAQVAISARSDELDITADQIRSETGSKVLAIRADVSEAVDIDALVERTLDQFGRIDILIINAGGPTPGDFLSLTSEHWEKAVPLTLLSAVRLCYAVVPHMVERGSGSIVATESYSAKQPIENLVLSNSLRVAVIGLMKTLANELGPKGIRVNSINPSWTWTDRVQQLMEDRAQRNGTTVEDEVAKATAEIPLGRMGTTEEYGKAITWLASPAASFIHGHALLFDGGAIKTTI
ncbi:MAG: SDR family oxidoreductase [Anaerolineae bacterium]